MTKIRSGRSPLLRAESFKRMDSPEPLRRDDAALLLAPRKPRRRRALDDDAQLAPRRRLAFDSDDDEPAARAAVAPAPEPVAAAPALFGSPVKAPRPRAVASTPLEKKRKPPRGAPPELPLDKARAFATPRKQPAKRAAARSSSGRRRAAKAPGDD